MWLRQRLAEEPFRRLSVALGRQQEVDRLAAAVDSAIQVGPAALDLHVCLVHPPGAVAHAQVGADPLLQFGRIGLDPPADGAVVHLNASIQQHEREITVADREHQIPPHRPQDHLGVELPPFEGLILPYLGSLSTFGHPAACTRSGRRRKAATEAYRLASVCSDRHPSRARRLTRNAQTGLLRHSAETGFYVSNKPVTATRAAKAIRAHWTIENTSHYSRDVTLGEDRSRIRTNPGVFAHLRSFAFNILKANRTDTLSQDRYRAALAGIKNLLSLTAIRKR